MIYLDHNSTTEILPCVLDGINKYSEKLFNPSSVHFFGRESRKLLEEARNNIASSLGVALGRGEHKIIFTSGATEANNLILDNFKDGMILYSSIEHASIYDNARNLPNAKEIKVDSDGILDIEHLEILLKENEAKKLLVSVMYANNETGVIQDMNSIAELAHKYGAYIHSDCVQAFGKIDFDIKDLGIDFLSISAHKIGGITGIGALICPYDFHIKSMIFGGGQEKGERSGTENLVGAISFGIASLYVKENLREYIARTSSVIDYIEKELKIAGANIISEKVNRIANTLMFTMEGKNSNVQLIALDHAGIAVSNGSACSSGKVKNSHVLKAMGYGENIQNSAIRISAGRNNDIKDAKAFVEIWKNMVAR